MKRLKRSEFTSTSVFALLSRLSLFHFIFPHLISSSFPLLRPHRDTARLIIRKIQYAPSQVGAGPKAEICKSFIMSDKPVHLEASMEKDVRQQNFTSLIFSFTLLKWELCSEPIKISLLFCRSSTFMVKRSQSRSKSKTRATKQSRKLKSLVGTSIH